MRQFPLRQALTFDIININPQTNQQYAQAENFEDAQNFYLMLSMQTDLTPWWQIQGKATAGWQQNRALYEEMNVQVQKMYGTISKIHNFRISNDFSAELTGIYQTSSLFGIGYLKSLEGLLSGTCEEEASLVTK